MSALPPGAEAGHFPYDAGGGGGGLGTVSLSNMSPVLSILGLRLPLGAACLVIKYTDTDTDTDVLFEAGWAGDSLKHVRFAAGDRGRSPTCSL